MILTSKVPILLLFSVFRVFPAFATPSPQSADAAYINGRIWTVDSARPEAGAVAVSGGRILAVGSTDEIRAFIGGNTAVVDLRGRLMVPGFIDNHTHFISGGFQMSQVNLRHVKDEAEFARIIAARAREYPGKWITGGDWDHDLWRSSRLPARDLIDPVTSETPVFVSRYDGHMGLANSAALKLAGITKDTPDPVGGTIVRDPATGEPTGILKDAAMDPIWPLIPDPAEGELLRAARAALAEANRHGITSVQDMAYAYGAGDIGTYEELNRLGELTARMYCRTYISDWKSLADAGVHAGSGSEMIRLGSLKGFADGSLGSSTALFFEKYLNEDTYGLPGDALADGRLERWMTSADSARLQLSIHAIGDSANSLILGIFARIAGKNPPWDRRFRIEHAQHISPEDFSRFRALNVIACVQPYHAIDDGRWAAGRIGEERCKTTYAFRTFLDNGVRICFGSDWTVAPISPVLGIYAAVTRRTTDGANPSGWHPEQKISVAEAIRGYTIDAAYAAFEENEKGSITTGKMADFTVLEDDILAIDPAAIENVQVAMTILGGKIVYRSRPD